MTSIPQMAPFIVTFGDVVLVCVLFHRLFKLHGIIALKDLNVKA